MSILQSTQAHSALSSILPVVNRFMFGEQPLIKWLLREIFKERPTFPRYTVRHDDKYVLGYVKKCSIFSETSLELTSKSLVTMMCILSGQKSQTFASLSTDCMCFNNLRCVFYISKLMKTSRPKSHQQPIESKA